MDTAHLLVQAPVPAPLVSVHPLARIRQQRSWTMTDVARIVVHRSGLNMASWKQKVYRWERQGVVPEPAAQHALAAELGIPAEAVATAGWPAWLTLADPVEAVDESWTVESAHRVLGRVVESVAMDRREFLVYGGSTLSCVAGQWSTNPPPEIGEGLEGAEIGARAVESLQRRVADLWRLDDLLGGGATLEPSLADLRLAYLLLSQGRYSADVGRQLFSAVAGLARFAGWAAFDAGRLSASQRLWHAALRAAHTANDTGQAVYILSNLALQSIYSNDGSTAIEMLETARSRVDSCSRTVRAMLDTWQVRAHVLLGDYAAACRLLNRADDLWGSRRAEDDPEWVYWMPQPTLTAEAGTAVLHMGQLGLAEKMLSEGLASLDSNSARDRNLYLIRLAETHLHAGELDKACDSARHAIDAVAGVDSQRVSLRMNAVLGQLPPGEPFTAELREYAREHAR